MGRAMLIIVAGVLISLGITQTSVFGGLNNLVGHSTNYAETAQAKNIAYMGTELAIQKMISENWRNDDHPFFIGGGEVVVSVKDTIDNQIKLVSTGTFNNQTQEVTLLLSEQTSSVVPTFFAALGYIMTDAGLFSFTGNGNPLITGISDNSECESKPGVMINHSDDESEIRDNLGGASSLLGDPDLKIQEGMTFDEFTKLIDTLAPYGKVPVDASGKGKFDEGPNIYTVNSNIKFAGSGSQGSGILIVRNSGKLEVEGEIIDGGIDAKGSFQFDGLVIFENAFELDMGGNAVINGSVLIGNTLKYINPFSTSLKGTPDIKYDCSAQEYANQAAQGISNSTYFQQMSVYEN